MADSQHLATTSLANDQVPLAGLPLPDSAIELPTPPVSASQQPTALRVSSFPQATAINILFLLDLNEDVMRVIIDQRSQVDGRRPATQGITILACWHPRS